MEERKQSRNWRRGVNDVDDEVDSGGGEDGKSDSGRDEVLQMEAGGRDREQDDDDIDDEGRKEVVVDNRISTVNCLAFPPKNPYPCHKVF